MSRRRQSVTIRHVAADAGVSLQTVSRVINKEAGVRPEMQQRVQASIEKLGYVPSLAAQRMSGSRSYLILALNDRERTISDWQKREGGDWVGQMMLGGCTACAEHGYRMIVELIDTNSANIERELAGAIAALQPDGAILTPPHSQNQDILDYLHKAGIKIARIGSQTPGPGFCITMDDEGGARRATEHLLTLGHRRIGFIAGPEDYELSAWRVAGWKAAMAAAGLPTDDLLVTGDFTYASGLEAARNLLDHARPSAIIASNDQMAIASLAVVRGRGQSVPQDLSIVSFDDTPIIRYATPPITAVAQPIAAATEKAARLIIAACASNAKGDSSELEMANVASDLVLRESTRAVKN
ncbi:LacI family DNA-binding transcriptional regulator [Altericroceibacterium endophyticum]|uniref:LacI family DNA-binding transcriptional regulator n=1 Tax=Altericroceibacterium endophyticum TaxID=1808508 RepID=A0A6I4T874_9SPHN|nr:LacI family DNA-binding transcriptional regulator [Altericroceibacterium endophyticum]MXO67126.1 LacI family DNA-binding transcriptional regulator [Altericroceibacterium endophyticum]